jgi:monoamine oxidase
MGPGSRFDRSLRLGLAERGLVVDDLGNARETLALDLRRRPKLRAHQRLAAVEISLAYLDLQHCAGQLAELFHPGEQRLIDRYRALAADAKRLVDPRHEEDQLQETGAFDDIPKTIDAVVAGAIRHQQPVRAFDMHEARRAAARRGVDAAVGA